MDTLGWLLLERGEAARAVGLFEEAVAKAPGNPQFSYHLAQGLARADQKERAKEILQELLQDKRLEAEHSKIREMLKQIES
jgi:predicted Zn-dependent protease